MDTQDQRTIARILKVNHAGEYGAIRIYRAQLWIARRRFPDIVPFLEETLGHEITHCEAFRGAMPEHEARPCRFMALWGIGGWVLGVFTAMVGRQGIWICTAAVESAVHRHLDDQIYFLRRHHPGLCDQIATIQEEELLHLETAENHVSAHGTMASTLRGFIFVATDVVIWLSTWGDSTRMAQALITARNDETVRLPIQG